MAPPAHDPHNAASFQRRLLAAACDAAAIFWTGALLHAFAYGLLVRLFHAESSQAKQAVMWIATYWLPVYLYFALMESSAWQSTLGKRLLGLRVVEVYGSRIGVARSLARNAIKLLPWVMAHFVVCFPRALPAGPRWLFACYGLIALYVAAAMLTLRKQSVHDLAAGTYVAKTTAP
jgi:uncharacterized RDD family membrane protein YckC